MFKQLLTTAPGVTETDVAPLKEYVEALAEGNEWSPRVVNFVDAEAEKRAKQALSSMTQSLAGGVLVGLLATVAGVFSTFVLTAQNLGAAIFALFIGGGSATYAVVRAVHAAGQAGEQTWAHSWGWASSLGQASDRQLTLARQLQGEIARAASGHVWPIPPFTARARSRAQLLVGAMWVLIGLGVALVGYGFVTALGEWSQNQVPTIPS